MVIIRLFWLFLELCIVVNVFGISRNGICKIIEDHQKCNLILENMGGKYEILCKLFTEFEQFFELVPDYIRFIEIFCFLNNIFAAILSKFLTI